MTISIKAVWWGGLTLLLAATSAHADRMDVQVVEDSGDRIVLSYDFPDYHMQQVDVFGSMWTVPVLPGESNKQLAGYPNLPDISRAIIIPDTGQMAVRVIDATWHDVKGVTIAPSKGTIMRNVDPATVPFTFGDAYRADAFWPAELATIREPHIMRDIRGTVVTVNPFQYNPQQGILRVLDTLTVEVSVDGPGGANILSRSAIEHGTGPAFDLLYDRHFINYDRNNRYDPMSDDGDLLIICYDDFMPNIQPLITHKSSIGINTSVVTVSSIGNSATSIKNYIQSTYDGGNLGFVLLVGDSFQITAPSSAGGASDPSYGMLSGSDHYPEIIIGRFSAESGTHVDTQVERTIAYEEDAATQEDWYMRAIGIGSAEGAGIGDDGEADWEHQNNIRADLLAYGYTQVDQVYDPGATSAQISSGVNAGRGLINYTGHGSTTAWSTTGFNNTNVNALINTGTLPWIVSVACVNGEYDGPTCFAEAWLRATSGGDPSGAILAYMSSINQSWAEPMSAQDEIVDLFCAEQYRCCGVLCMAGSCLMIDEYGGVGEDMMDTWIIFGDPTLCVVGTTAPPTGLKVAGSGLHAGGPLGGPFVPDSAIFTLTNHNATTIQWTADADVSWVDVSPESGSILGGGSAEVTVSLNGGADDLHNGLHEGEIAFVNQTNHDGDIVKQVSVNVGVPVQIYEWTLDLDPGWSTSGQWAFGHPSGQGGSNYGNADPSNGATGSNVYGVNLNGDYSTSPGGPYFLITDAIDCSMLVDTQLKFQRWLNSDYQPYVYANVYASSDGETWIELWGNGSSETTDSSWNLQEFDISAVADGEETVYIAWTYQVENFSWAYSGWNIDDIEILGVDTSGGGEGCADDVSGDGMVDVTDMLAIIAAWGPCEGCDEDVTGDGFADVSDLLSVIAAWGPCE